MTDIVRDWLGPFVVTTASILPPTAGVGWAAKKQFEGWRDSQIAEENPPSGAPAPNNIGQAQATAEAAPVPPDPAAAGTASKWIGMPDGYDYDPEAAQKGDKPPAYESGQDVYALNKLLREGGLVAAKKLLKQAGYYGNDEPVFAGVVTEEDVKAINTAMAETNRSDLPGWEAAAQRRVKNMAGADGVDPKERAKFKAAYHASVNDIARFAYDNGIKLHQENIAKWSAQAAATGKKSTDEIKARLTDKFVARMYPALKEDLQAGVTVREAAGPYLQTVADLLGDTNPSLHDPLIKKALQGRTEKGEPVTMPLWQFEEEGKKGKRYQYSDAAWADEGDKFYKVMQMFGVQP